MDQNQTSNFKALIIPWTIWLIVSFFYFFQYFLRTSISGMSPDLVKYMHINALTLGNIAAGFYWAYVAFKIPSGLLIDFFGTRAIVSLSALLTGIATLLFAMSNHIVTLEISRWIMGAGATTALVGTLTTARHYLKREHFPIASGLTMVIGAIGGALGGEPLQRMLGYYTLETIAFVAGGIALIISFMIFLSVRIPLARLSRKERLIEIGLSLKSLINNRQVWATSLTLGFLYVPVTSYFSVWAVGYLSTYFNTAPDMISLASIASYVGLGVGSLVMAYFSNLVKSRVWPLRLSLLLVLVIELALFYFPMEGAVSLVIFQGLLGFFMGASVITVVIIRESVPEKISGTAFAFNNMFQVMVGTITIPLIGWLLVKDFRGIHVDRIFTYPSYDYRSALMILPVCAIIGLILSFFIRETYGRLIST